MFTNPAASLLILLVLRLFSLQPVVAASTDPSDVLQQLPECAVECIVAGAAEHDCDVADLPCQCLKIEAITKTVSPCLVKDGCDLEQITNTVGVVAEVCKELASSADSTDTRLDPDSPESTSSDSETQSDSTEDDDSGAGRFGPSDGAVVVVVIAAIAAGFF